MIDITTPSRHDGDLELLSGQRVQELEDELVRLAVHLNCTTYKMLQVIRELDEHEVAQCLGFCSTAHYLNWRIGLDKGAAREKVRVARALAKLPLTSRSLACGSISYAKTRALTRIATPETEEALLNIALQGTATHVEEVVRKFRRAKNGDLELNERHEQGRYLHTYHDDDGMLVIEARLPPDEGALLVKALEAAQDLAFKQAKQVAGVSAETPLTPSQKRADALGRVAKAALHRGLAGLGDVNEHGEPAATIDAASYQVVVHVDAEVLADAKAEGRCELDHGPHVSAETSRRMACDCDRVVMLHHANGTVMDVGRKVRVVPTPLRRALAERDHGHCCFPGCMSTHLEAHHVRHWAQGGPTNLSNLLSACPRHHRFLHEAGYTVRRDAAGAVEFVAPSGRALAAAGVLVPADDEAFSTQWREIQQGSDPAADIAAWGGERMDYDWAVAELMPAAGEC